MSLPMCCNVVVDVVVVDDDNDNDDVVGDDGDAVVVMAVVVVFVDRRYNPEVQRRVAQELNTLSYRDLLIAVCTGWQVRVSVCACHRWLESFSVTYNGFISSEPDETSRA